MGKLGRWIDGLTDEQKDRIVRTQSWFWQSHVDSGYHGGRYCIAGAVFDLDTASAIRRHEAPAGQYDRLCCRFPGERIVRACKQRAAATMSDEVEAPAPEKHARSTAHARQEA